MSEYTPSVMRKSNRMVMSNRRAMNVTREPPDSIPRRLTHAVPVVPHIFNLRQRRCGIPVRSYFLM